jgi:hypothetical protein
MRLTGNKGLFGRYRSSVGTLVAFLIQAYGVLDTGLWRSDDDAEKEIVGMAVLEMTCVVGEMMLRFLVNKAETDCKPGCIYTHFRVTYVVSQEQHQGYLLYPSLSLCFAF